jgi:4-aminobutyrate aminotransferase-like enzyme
MERIGLIDKQVRDRIAKSTFGPREKDLLRRRSEVESYGSSSLGIFGFTTMIVKAKSSHQFDGDGKDYIDLLAGLSVSNLGHCNEEVSKIIEKQADKLIHFFAFPREVRMKMSATLTHLSRNKPKTRVMYGVSGSEGIELAVWAIRSYTGQPCIHQVNESGKYLENGLESLMQGHKIVGEYQIKG